MANSSMPWVKLYTDLLDDPKIDELPELTAYRFVKLIILAGDCDAEGALISGGTPFTTRYIARRLRLQEDDIAADMQMLCEVGLLRLENSTYIVVNFAKRQGRSQTDKRKEWRERQQRKREHDPKGSGGVTRDSRVSHAGIPLQDKEQDKDLFELNSKREAHSRISLKLHQTGIREGECDVYAKSILLTSNYAEVERRIDSYLLDMPRNKAVRNPAGLMVAQLRELGCI
jgi:hypothetical protein